MKEKDIKLLIEKYFEGATTLHEERALREALLKSGSDDPQIVEAKAVMAYVGMASSTLKTTDETEDIQHKDAQNSQLLMKSAKKNKMRRPSFPQPWSIAASIAVLIVCVAALLWFMPERSDYYTMIACVEDSSRDAAIDLIGSQLQALGEASDDVETDVLESLNLVMDF